MQCPICKKEIKSDSFYCEYCGSRIKPEVKPSGKSGKFWKWSTIISVILLVISLISSAGRDANSSSTQLASSESDSKNTAAAHPHHR